MVASCTRRPKDESAIVFAGVVVVAVNATFVFAGTEAAAGSVNVPVTPTVAGTAIACAVLAATGAVVEALAGASVATEVGAETGVAEATLTGKVPTGPFDPPPHAASIAANASETKPIPRLRPAKNGNLFNANEPFRHIRSKKIKEPA